MDSTSYCPICMCEKRRVVSTPCKHTFCKQCIKKVYKLCPAKLCPLCPLCRAPFGYYTSKQNSRIKIVFIT